MSAKAAFARLSGHQRIAGQLVQSSSSAAINVWDPQASGDTRESKCPVAVATFPVSQL
jgi:hypothetical protein